MKNILFLVGQYLPYSSANGNIAHNIITELKKQGYSITVITRKNRKELKEYEILEDIKVYRIRDINYIIHSYCKEKIQKGNKIFKLILLIKRFMFYIPKIFRRTSISNYYVKKIERKIKKINKNNKIEVIIPVSSPHEEMFAALRFKEKHKTVKLLPYQLDRFANGNSLYSSKIAKGKKVQRNLMLEKNLLKASDKYFVLPPIYNHYKKDNRFKNYFDKIEITEHPLIQNLKKEKANNSGSIKILYAGALDTNLRNPTYLLKMLSDGIIKSSNIQLDLYSFGNCQAIIDKYKAIAPNTIIDKGKVSHSEVVKKMQKADILLSIGNNSTEEVPSKLFEYLSFCKPIIHLYYTEKDAYIKYLKDYKYSICIKMEESKVKENAKLLYKFCKNNSNVNVPYGTVEKNFKECTPEYVAKQFIKAIEENKNE